MKSNAKKFWVGLFIILTVAVIAVFAGGAFCACSARVFIIPNVNGSEKDVGSGGVVADATKWSVYDGLAVGFVSDGDCPNGDIDESKSVRELNARLNERHYMVADFTMQAPQDNDGKETLTVEVKITPASAVSATLQETQSGNISEETAGGATKIRATYKIPDKASVQRKIRLVVRIDAVQSGCAGLELNFFCREELQPVKTLKVKKQAMLGYTEGLLFSSGAVIGVADKTVDKVVIPSMVDGVRITSVNVNALIGCVNMCEVIIPESVSRIGASAFNGCKSLKEIKIPDGVTAIYDYTFSACEALEKVVLPDGLTRIGKQVFKGCTALTEINLPDGVTEIGAKAFEGCEKVIEKENSVHYIGKWAVGSESVLKSSVELRADTVGISDDAFRGKSITEIKIPAGVKFIGDGAFAGCGTITINFDGTKEEWDAVKKDYDWAYHTTVKMLYCEEQN